ncbi:flavin reductase family protein [Singulisphaera sp. PoT]|uniref:flavin reductase family protein n=1 Tax=Singulisphaera sp. PoT TaxID=3411797 RepID=UPI003BF5D943
MAETPRPYPDGLSHALGQIPSGLFILTVRKEGRSTGMLASWVQQAGFEPPMLTVAVKRDRFVADWIQASGKFTLNQLPDGAKGLLRHFGRGFEPGSDAFQGIEVRQEASGGPVLEEALAFLDSEVVAHLAESDHIIFLARVVGGELFARGTKPFLHVRGNGFHY